MDEIQAKARRSQGEWKLRSRRLPVGRRTLIMGIVNVTPDSFSDGGKYFDPQKAVAHALQLLDEGADMLDLGAESTRPGSPAASQEALSPEAEQARLLPVLEALLQARPEAVVSVDTYRASTARQAVEAGAEIINDVSGFLWDPEMARVCAEAHCGVVLMHTRGLPSEWKNLPELPLGSVLPLVRDGLAERVGTALASGIPPESLVIDPGYGFGKRFDENFDLLVHQHELLDLGCPLLAGVSRKGFLTRTLTGRGKQDDESREAVSLAGMVVSILGGASIVRVHQVRTAVAAAVVADTILAHETE